MPVQEIARDIFQEQSPKQLYQVRGKLYELLVNCLPPELILRKLALALIRTLDDEVRHKCIALAAAYEHRLQASHDRNNLPRDPARPVAGLGNLANTCTRLGRLCSRGVYTVET